MSILTAAQAIDAALVALEAAIPPYLTAMAQAWNNRPGTYFSIGVQQDRWQMPYEKIALIASIKPNVAMAMRAVVPTNPAGLPSSLAQIHAADS